MFLVEWSFADGHGYVYSMPCFTPESAAFWQAHAIKQGADLVVLTAF